MLVSKGQFLTQHRLVHTQAVAFTVLIKSLKSTVVTVVQILTFKLKRTDRILSDLFYFCLKMCFCNSFYCYLKMYKDWKNFYPEQACR